MVSGIKFSDWLHNSVTESSDKKYRHRLFKEHPGKHRDILSELTLYVQNAHEDARYRLRKLAENSLDPLDPKPTFDPAAGYPEIFHIQTLKGYFGEIFAGLIAEHFSPFGEDGWKVPAFLFRFHGVEFQQLELLRHTGGTADLRPGRTGDDCLAFTLDKEGEITRFIYCEAKCTPSHDTTMIADAHKKVGESVFPVDLPQILEILQLRTDTVSRAWVRAVYHLWLESTEHKSEHCNMVSYICGVSPVRGGRLAWLPTDKPHEQYKAQRRLEAVEIHLPDVEQLIREVYGKPNVEDLVSVGSATEDEIHGSTNE